jgi:hypothetical protein
MILRLAARASMGKRTTSETLHMRSLSRLGPSRNAAGNPRHGNGSLFRELAIIATASRFAAQNVSRYFPPCSPRD